MSELTVILDRKNLVVTMESGVLRLDQPGCNPEKIPLNLTREVIVFGSPAVSCDVWRKLSEHNIPAVLLPSRGKGEPAYMGAGLTTTAVNRLGQYRAAENPKTVMKICKLLLKRKLDGQAALLKSMSGRNGKLVAYARRINEIAADTVKGDSRNSLMGYEGAAASIYFKALGALLDKKWKFAGRNRRPPMDPVNSLLSLSYVMAAGEVLRRIQIRGLDPAICFFHTIQPGRAGFVLDVLEPIRPKIDQFVLGLLDNPLTPNQFTIGKTDGCRMNKDARRIYYDAWAMWRNGANDEETELKSAVRDIVRRVVDLF